MKYIQSREQFIGEAVEVKTNRYQRTHGKKPKGFGQWAFYFDDMGGEPIFVPKAMNYSDAVKWAKGEAKKAGKREIYVGESLNEARKPKAWDSMFSMNAIKAYQDGEFNLDDKASILAWDTKYNGGRPPKPAFNTKEIVDYAIKTGKKPDGSKMEESVNEQLSENYDTEQRREMAKKGLALPDGSFPIKTVEDLKNAIQTYGRAKDHSKAAKFIAKRAKALNADDLIPDTEDFQKALKEAEFGRIPKFGE